MNIKTFYCNPFRECTYILSATNGLSAIIDCGAINEQEWTRIYNYITDNKLKPHYHLLTHAHLDHCFGSYFVKRDFGLLPTLHEADKFLFEHLKQQTEMFGVDTRYPFLAEFLPLHIGNDISLSELTIHPILTPGHTKGGVSYQVSEGDKQILFSGDTMFYGGYGRTDLPGGDYLELTDSLNRLKQLPNETIVYPGHGIITTIEKEKNSSWRYF